MNLEILPESKYELATVSGASKDSGSACMKGLGSTEVNDGTL